MLTHQLLVGVPLCKGVKKKHSFEKDVATKENDWSSLLLFAFIWCTPLSEDYRILTRSFCSQVAKHIWDI